MTQAAPKSDLDIQFDAGALAIEHEQTLEALTEDQQLVLSRELLAIVIRMKARQAGQIVGRAASLDAVFVAEAQARAAGATPQLDIFTPIGRELPGEDLG
jgi:hypothetical protein